jgi:hypothetical protein
MSHNSINFNNININQHCNIDDNNSVNINNNI